MSCKKYVEVTARFDVDGTVFPLEIHWEDGAKFEIDRILDIRPGGKPQDRRSGNPVYLPDSEAGKNICGWKKPGGL